MWAPGGGARARGGVVSLLARRSEESAFGDDWKERHVLTRAGQEHRVPLHLPAHAQRRRRPGGAGQIRPHPLPFRRHGAKIAVCHPLAHLLLIALALPQRTISSDWSQSHVSDTRFVKANSRVYTRVCALIQKQEAVKGSYSTPEDWNEKYYFQE